MICEEMPVDSAICRMGKLPPFRLRNGRITEPEESVKSVMHDSHDARMAVRSENEMFLWEVQGMQAIGLILFDPDRRDARWCTAAARVTTPETAAACDLRSYANARRTLGGRDG